MVFLFRPVWLEVLTVLTVCTLLATGEEYIMFGHRLGSCVRLEYFHFCSVICVMILFEDTAGYFDLIQT